jgi:threonine/homoserine/homoserine lactone efflux protein
VGIGVGAIIWATTALFGLAVIFQLAPALLTGFKIVGGLYLAWMGWQMWRAAAVPLDLADTGRPPRSLGSAFLLGVGTQLANPKPAVFFGAVFVGTIPPGTNAAVYAALLSVIFLNETLWNILVARIFSLDRARRGYIGLKSVIDRCFGGLLGLLGLKIALT